jgi:pilus assembly protein HofO
MKSLFERWCALAPRWRCAVWFACSLHLLLGWLFLHYQPAQQRLIAQEAQRQREAASQRAIWASARKLYPPPANKIAPPSQPFTPLAFNANGLRLVRWQPATAGGELAIAAAWTEIPAIFSALALHDVAVAHFSVAPEKQTLQVVLQLERRNAG